MEIESKLNLDPYHHTTADDAKGYKERLAASIDSAGIDGQAKNALLVRSLTILLRGIVRTAKRKSLTRMKNYTWNLKDSNVTQPKSRPTK
jgi:hypothetical protein